MGSSSFIQSTTRPPPPPPPLALESRGTTISSFHFPTLFADHATPLRPPASCLPFSFLPSHTAIDRPASRSTFREHLCPAQPPRSTIHSSFPSLILHPTFRSPLNKQKSKKAKKKTYLTPRLLQGTCPSIPPPVAILCPVYALCGTPPLSAAHEPLDPKHVFLLKTLSVPCLSFLSLLFLLLQFKSSSAFVPVVLFLAVDLGAVSFDHPRTVLIAFSHSIRCAHIVCMPLTCCTLLTSSVGKLNVLRCD